VISMIKYDLTTYCSREVRTKNQFVRKGDNASE
jgi:hypothetical protein